MSSRDAILADVRANRPRVQRPLPEIPRFSGNPSGELLDVFRQALTDMGGDLVAPGPDGDVLAPLSERLGQAAVICSATPEVAGNRLLADVRAPGDLHDVDLGVVRASFAVAETGSVCLTEQDLGIRALGYLPQHLLVLLDPADIVPSLHHAFDRAAFLHHRYVVLHTGPSATADIEGVLIHGAQGVRSLSVSLVPRPLP